jgi:hypothetical protein
VLSLVIAFSSKPVIANIPFEDIQLKHQDFIEKLKLLVYTPESTVKPLFAVSFGNGGFFNTKLKKILCENY